MSKPVALTESEFVSLLEANQAILHKVCRMYTRTDEARRDLFQDIATQMWRAWPNFRHGSKVSTWMYRIALNVAISGLRKPVLATETLTEDQHRLPHTESEITDEVASLYAALDGLSKVEKSFALLLLDDYSYEEMAEVTGLTTDHLRVKMFRIREKLRFLIQQQLNTL
ncbi:MAG: RNA polymerase sigma factor [Saprospiraceae bacterium]